MILKNLFSKKKKLKWIQWKKITGKKKSTKYKKALLFCKDSGIYGVFCICYRLI